MHYLLATWDGGGTVPIDMGIARRLTARGHTVTVLGDPTIAEEADRAGAEFVPWRNAPHRRSTALEDDVLKDWECRNQLELFRRVTDRLITGPAAAFAAETAAELARRPAEVAVVDAAILGPMVATEALVVPTVAVCPGIYILPVKGMPPFGLGLQPVPGLPGRLRDTAINAVVKAAWRSGLPALNAARAQYGLSALSDPWDQLRCCDSVLITTARTFDFPAQLPEFAHYVGPIVDDPVWAAGPVEISSEEDLPLIVVGLSSTFVQGQDQMLRRITAALATLPVRGLVCTGPTIDPIDIPGTERVRVVRSAPHHDVFPQASVIVTHGGHGTMLKALAAGKPVLCLPGFRDQKDNAVRMTTRGAGLSLKPHASSAQIAAAVQRLVDEPGFVAAAADLGRRIRAEIDDTALIQLLERSGSERKVDLVERSSAGQHDSTAAAAGPRRTVSASTEIAAPPRTIFAILANPRQHVRIDGSGSVRKTIEGPERLTLGAEFKVSMKLYGLRYVNRNRVVEMEPDRLIAWRHWAPHRWRYELDATPEGRTRVTESCDFNPYPVWGMAIARLMHWPSRNQEWIERSLANLKVVAEADAQTER